MRQTSLKTAVKERYISIHALVKRATATAGEAAVEAIISIHALVKRATALAPARARGYSHFNPRPRKEGDKGIIVRIKQRHHFNPRPRKEGDFATAGEAAVEAIISIHALAKRATCKKDCNFNEELKISIHALAKRATKIDFFYCNINFISIHALAKRATI